MNLLPHKSTIGRSFLGLSAVLAPSLVVRRTTEAFSRPRRLPPLDPVAEGWPARRFAIDTDAGLLAAWEWGDGPTVLLVHGWGGRAAQMKSFVAPLVARGFHVVAFDLPAHGSSPGERTNVIAVSHVIAQMARRFHPVRGLIAHSMGASASGLALAQGLGIQRAALIAPAAELTPFARAFATRLGLSERRVQDMLQRLDEELEGGLAATDLRQRSPGSGTQVLVVHDPDDARIPFAHGQQIVEAWPNARLCIARGVGHDGVLRDPPTVAQVVAHVAGFEAVRRAS